MKTIDYLRILQEEIHSTVFATVDEKGLPHTCVIDIMLYDKDGLYFLTAKGKPFYDRLMENGFVAISGMKGADTLSTVAVSVRGKVKEIGPGLLPELFERNPYMADIYSKKESRNILTVFQLYEGEGEYFDLSQLPPVRDSFQIGDRQMKQTGYRITSDCIECGTCADICPTSCIQTGTPYHIEERNCIHCGNCAQVCPVNAAVRL